MATGERIHHFRKRMKMTQRYLGQLLGFPANSADVRMAGSGQCAAEERDHPGSL
jgi:transcriptional regulator with XRE-family HTH domain